MKLVYSRRRQFYLDNGIVNINRNNYVMKYPLETNAFKRIWYFLRADNYTLEGCRRAPLVFKSTKAFILDNFANRAENGSL